MICVVVVVHSHAHNYCFQQCLTQGLLLNLTFKHRNMEEIIFLVEESTDGGYTAKGLGVSIYSQGDTMEALRTAVMDAVRCHYDNGKRRIIRLHIVREEVFTA